jgi:hypothetical protein
MKGNNMLNTQDKCLGLTAVFLAICFAAAAGQSAELIVDGKIPNANDTNPGTITRPLRTIQKAASLARAGDTVYIRAGTYRETVTPAHSGANGAPITYMPYNNEHVVIDGADRITNWTNYRSSIYRAPMNWSVNNGDGDQVFVDGRMMNYARFPNSSLDVSNPTRITADTGAHVPSSPAFLQACSGTYTSAALNGLPDSKHDSEWVGATIHFEVMGQGYLETGTVTSTKPGSVTFNYISQSGGPGDPAASDPFYITGKLVALDAGGEWFRDSIAKTLYLWTPTGDSPQNHVVEAKARTYGFELSGRSYITIQGIKFFACSINTSSTSTHNTIDRIQALYVSHFELVPGTQTLWTPHMEDTGIIIRGSNNILENSEIGFSAGNGVLLEGNNKSFSTGNVVTNNVIHDVDYMCLDEAGINSGNPAGGPGGPGPAAYGATSTYNTISYNTIYNSARSLILIRNFGSCLIVHNDLYNAMLQSLDGGAIYGYNQNGKAFNSSHPNTRIAYNRIHNTHTTYDKFDVGIYLDNNSFNYVVDHNLVYDVWAPLFLNSDSLHNTICNNTLFATAYGTACFQANGNGTGTLLANNIYCQRINMAGTKYTSSHNLEAKVAPLFVDPAGLNFQLQALSPAKDAGMVIHPYTDGFVGSAPDIGAFEYGATPWTAGAVAAKNPYASAVPVTPTHLTATASGSSVTLAWRNNDGNATGGYVLEGGPDDLDFTPIVSLPAPTTSYTDSATIYRFYRICAVNGQYKSGYSNFARSSKTSAANNIAAWTFSAASNPAGANWWDFWCDTHNWVKYSNVYFGSPIDKVNVSYAAPAGDKYRGNHLEFRLDSPTAPIIGYVVTQSTGGWNKFVTGSGTVRGVTAGVHDLYITCSPLNAPWPVVAIHSFKFSDTAGLAAPTGLVAMRASGSAVNLSWTNNSNQQAGFKIERSTDAQTFMEIGAVGANIRVYQDATGLPNMISYYRVRAYNPSSGNSACSNVATARH